jgi:hypothetical protein
MPHFPPSAAWELDCLSDGNVANAVVMLFMTVNLHLLKPAVLI